MGQRLQPGCCANHDWRADGNTHANTNSYPNYHTDSYSNSDSNSHAYSYSNSDTFGHANSYSDANSYRYPKTNTETTSDSAAAPGAAVKHQDQ